MNEFLYNVGERVIINVAQPDEYGNDPKTGLYIPNFFCELNGLEFEISGRLFGTNLYEEDSSPSCPRYILQGEYTSKAGFRHNLKNVCFDEYWLSPAGHEEICDDGDVSFY